MSYDVVRDFKTIQNCKELERRNARLVAALKAVTALDESGSYVARMEWRLRKETEAAITENEK